MKKNNTIRLIIFVGIILFSIVYKIWSDNSEMKALGFTGMKKETSIELPNEFVNLFKNPIRNSIKHLGSSIPNDNSSFPNSNIKINEQFISIFKFNSEFSINEILEIKKEKTKQKTGIWYRDSFYGDLTVNIARSTFKKTTENIELIINGKIEKILLNQETFLCNGNLKTLSIRFSKDNEINNIFIENNLFNYPEYSIAILKKENSIFLLLFPSNKISKNKFYELLNII